MIEAIKFTDCGVFVRTFVIAEFFFSFSFFARYRVTGQYIIFPLLNTLQWIYFFGRKIIVCCHNNRFFCCINILLKNCLLKSNEESAISIRYQVFSIGIQDQVFGIRYPETSYQNTVYNATSIPIMIVEPTRNEGNVRNIFASIVSAFGLFLLLRSARLITIINNISIRKTRVIRSIKGKSGNAPLVHDGRNLSTVERGMVRMADISAAVDVALFQKNPNRKIDSTPGDIKPTYSWINW